MVVGVSEQSAHFAVAATLFSLLVVGLLFWSQELKGNDIICFCAPPAKIVQSSVQEVAEIREKHLMSDVICLIFLMCHLCKCFFLHCCKQSQAL